MMDRVREGLVVRSWVASVIALGAGVLAVGLTQATSEDIGLLLALAALGAWAERYAVRMTNCHASVGVIAVLAAALVAGLWGIAFVVPVMLVVGEFGGQAVWYKRLYNIAAYLIAGAAFWAVVEPWGIAIEPDAWPLVLVPVGIGAFVNFGLNSALVAVAIGLSTGEAPLAAWRERFLPLLPQYVIIGMVALALATAYQIMGLWGVAVFAAPAAGIHQAYLHAARAVGGANAESVGLQRVA